MVKYAGFLNKAGHIFIFLGLNVFFVLHATNNFSEILQLKVVVNTLLGLCVLSVVYWLISLLILRNKKKASLFTTASFFSLLFYNGVQFLAQLLSSTGLLISDRILLGLIILIMFLLVFFSRAPSGKFLLFLKATLSILITYEMFFLIYNIATPNKSIDTVVNIQKKNEVLRRLPSVYLLVLDEYAGGETLVEKFNYPNSNFYNHLDSIGFKVLNNTHSNYQYTALSMASMLNCSFLHTKEGTPTYSPVNFRVAISAVYNSRVVETFRRMGYSINNYSPFSIRGLPSRYSNRFLHTDYWLILYSTFFDRIIEMAPYFIARKTGDTRMLERLFERQLNLTGHITSEVLENSRNRKTNPSFSYIHLMMPHAPYAADSTGKINIPFLILKSADKTQRMNAYLQYLVYTNNLIKDFVNELNANTSGESVIILLSDHGLRDQSVVSDTASKFNNLNAVYLPKDFFGSWYNGMTNVNQFRILFSALTKQEVPLLKDSLVH